MSDKAEGLLVILSNPLPLTPFQAVTLAVGPPWLGRSSVVGGGRDHKIELFSQPFSTFKKTLKLNSLLEIKKKKNNTRERNRNSTFNASLGPHQNPNGFRGTQAPAIVSNGDGI
ncbi:hypothetical protein V6Z12_A04G025700 [Gossypium hirsutum]